MAYLYKLVVDYKMWILNPNLTGNKKKLFLFTYHSFKIEN